jgi:putative N-acetyltransferase (TIGR04045 family)
MLIEVPPPVLPCEYRCKIATEQWELSSYQRLRREVFCDEQRMFEGSDEDEHDADALPVVAVSQVMGMADRVVGTVRIDQRTAGVWHGSRLAVHPDFRGVGGLGASLIRKAVSTAHGFKCSRFLAMVQSQNVLFFRRLHWKSIEEVSLLGRPHHLMEANLSAYPPCRHEQPIDILTARRAS